MIGGSLCRGNVGLVQRARSNTDTSLAKRRSQRGYGLSSEQQGASMTTQNVPRYIKSLSDELAANANRVRDLIGDAHWLSDGHHKERLLAGTMARHLPRRFAVTTGFLLDRHATSSCSREQDILVLDLWRHPLLFGTAELSITYSISAVASVSVKSQFKKDAFEDSWNTLASIPSPPEPLRRIAFFFDSDAPTRIVDWLLPLVKTGAPGADYIATTGDFFARIDRGDGFAKLRGFSTAGASFGTALASLVSDLSDGHETASEDLVFDIERLPATLLFDEDVRFDTH